MLSDIFPTGYHGTERRGLEDIARPLTAREDLSPREQARTAT
jgi:hypothetical protein